MSKTLRTLLDTGMQYDPAYLPDMNADHLPMTLVAMEYLGATESALLEYQQGYSQRLRPVVEGPILKNLEQGRGRAEAFSELRRLLMAEISQIGIDSTVKHHLPSLLPSMAAGAFHPLIRLGFALTSRHEGEVVSALAYWMTSGFQPTLVDATQAAQGSVSFAQQLAALPTVTLNGGRFGDGLRSLVEMDAYPSRLRPALMSVPT